MSLRQPWIDIMTPYLKEKPFSSSLYFPILVNFSFQSLHIMHCQQLFRAFTSFSHYTFYLQLLFHFTCMYFSYIPIYSIQLYLYKKNSTSSIICIVCAAEKWTLTLMVVVPPVILALRWYRQADQFTSSLAYIMSSRLVWAM